MKPTTDFYSQSENYHDIIKSGTSRKDDTGKLDFTLLDDLDEALRQVVGVMQWAITEKSNPYTRGSFRGIHPDRYLAAMLRHYYSTGKDRMGIDHESKMLHLAHVATSALMALQNLFEEVQGGNSNAV